MKIQDVYPSYYQFVPRSLRDVWIWLKINLKLVRWGRHQLRMRQVAQNNVAYFNEVREEMEDKIRAHERALRKQEQMYMGARREVNTLQVAILSMTPVIEAAEQVCGQFGPHVDSLRQALAVYYQKRGA